MKIGVIGGGSWGTALAKLVADQGHKTTIWCHSPNRAAEINEYHENKTYLPGAKLPETLSATNELAQACADASLIISVVPSHTLRKVMGAAAQYIPFGVPILSATKGIENDSLMTMSEVIEDVLPVHCHPYIAYLGGPSFAKEVAARLPTAVVVAAHSEKLARNVQEIISADFFRVYTSIDVVGVEFGGALKNVIAIAAGAADGMGLGTNSRAGMVTRGLAEISRLAVRRGANPLTLSGLSGMGDLVLTCYGALSRNRTVGYKLGTGMKLADILAEMKMVAEGVKTAKSAHDLAKKLNCETPITDQVYEVLYHDKSAVEAVTDLMSRDLKREREPY
ncbi:MAG: glycerol-3-phosphate dehydrogenase [Deltaproteobacteria bacterium CG2_30_63_29]|nr:MAG: glycerol-3-phosphate dehydrogenase [Deltaproteobacteria bacterium CG2_30_63_29]PJB49204.1 MAG: glycerol-3-phosphate dehydrogenase [Deltaproteobacteria bacterium CG_4_9_14_3_um_filter_63_12]